MATVPFSFRLDEDVKARLENEAKIEDRSAAYLVQKALEEYLDEKDYKRECIGEVIAEANKGIFVSEEAVDRWVEAWGIDHELPMPQPDIFPAKQGA